MTPIQNDLRFPVIHHFSVNNYELYPGDKGDGFTYDVKPGVNIVVGVNGLGKTTLLNLLMKMVAGPGNIYAVGGLGMGGRIETKSNPRFFSSRVKDGAARASATVTLGFGEKRLTVTRKLSNLEITSFEADGIKVDGLTADAFEDRFKFEVLQFSGLQQFYDYLLLVHFVFFFLEDRQALIWDEDAQSEILRVLYYDPTQQITYRNLYNKVAQHDSEIRNTQAVLSRHEKNLSAELLKRADDTTARELKSLRKTVDKLRDAIDVSEERVEELNTTRLSYRDQLEHLKVQREEKISRARAANEEYLRKEFAEAENEALYAVASAISQRGCIFCGSTTERAMHAVLHKVNVHQCPLCESDRSEREIPDISSDTTALIELAQMLEEEAENSSESIAALEKLLRESSDAYETGMNTLVQQRKQHQEIRLQAQLLENGVPKNEDQLKNLQDKLLGFREILDYTKQEKAEAETALLAIIDPGETRVAAVADGIIKRFKEYITGFMAETCVLHYDVREKRIGQGPSTVKFRFPCFTVRLTSGVFKEEASNRLTQNDVSESQREFIDLAFRMALIAEITKHSAAMLVVETPEASLDSVFVPRAGNMVRKFLQVTPMLSNYLVASTNLNREAMIPALFGVLPEVEAVQLAQENQRSKFNQRVAESVASNQRLDRMVNLLEVAAKNAALTKYKDEYEDEFQRAVFPPWEKFETAKGLGK